MPQALAGRRLRIRNYLGASAEPQERSPQMSSTQLWESELGQTGSRDGQGAGDHDQPYRFGWRPRASVPFPFNTREYARLLVFRSRIQDELANRRADQDINATSSAA